MNKRWNVTENRRHAETKKAESMEGGRRQNDFISLFLQRQTESAKQQNKATEFNLQTKLVK